MRKNLVQNSDQNFAGVPMEDKKSRMSKASSHFFGTLRNGKQTPYPKNPNPQKPNLISIKNDASQIKRPWDASEVKGPQYKTKSQTIQKNVSGWKSTVKTPLKNGQNNLAEAKGMTPDNFKRETHDMGTQTPLKLIVEEPDSELDQTNPKSIKKIHQNPIGEKVENFGEGALGNDKSKAEEKCDVVEKSMVKVESPEEKCDVVEKSMVKFESPEDNQSDQVVEKSMVKVKSPEDNQSDQVLIDSEVNECIQNKKDHEDNDLFCVSDDNEVVFIDLSTHDKNDQTQKVVKNLMEEEPVPELNQQPIQKPVNKFMEEEPVPVQDQHKPDFTPCQDRPNEDLAHDYLKNPILATEDQNDKSLPENQQQNESFQTFNPFLLKNNAEKSSDKKDQDKSPNFAVDEDEENVLSAVNIIVQTFHIHKQTTHMTDEVPILKDTNAIPKNQTNNKPKRKSQIPINDTGIETAFNYFKVHTPHSKSRPVSVKKPNKDHAGQPNQNKESEQRQIRKSKRIEKENKRRSVSPNFTPKENMTRGIIVGAGYRSKSGVNPDSNPGNCSTYFDNNNVLGGNQLTRTGQGVKFADDSEKVVLNQTPDVKTNQSKCGERKMTPFHGKKCDFSDEEEEL